MRAALVCALSALALACNAVLGITETSSRSDVDAGGQASGSSAGARSSTPSCATNAECLERSDEYAPEACIAGRCVPLLTPECPIALPQTESRWLSNLRHSDPDALIIGAFASVPATLFGMDSRNYDLALTELSRAVGGLPAAGGKRRPVLAVVCRNLYATSEGLDRAVDHLLGELQVPAVLAGLVTSDLEYAFRRKGLANHVFFMSPFDADRSLVDLVDDGLVWHMLSGGEQLAPTYTPLLARTLALLRRSGQLGEKELARVALVTTEDVRMLSAISGALSGGLLQFNGRSAQQNAPDYFRAVSIPSSSLAAETPDYGDAVRALSEFAPHVVIGLATDEFISTIIPALEAGSANSGTFYLLSPWHYKNRYFGLLFDLVPKIYSRLAGVNYAAAEDSRVYDDYQARFDAAYPAFAGTRGNENFYDAAYYVSYAAAAAGTVTPLFGSDLVNGMRRLLSGRVEFRVGPSDLSAAFMALEAQGSSIVLNGAMGPPNFDPRTGARTEPGTVWCVDVAGKMHADVLRLDASGNLLGTFPCFELDP
jgi:hypothetical protein